MTLSRESLLQFGKFILVGVVNTGFSYLIYAVGLAFGLHYALANLTAMITGILFSFKSQGHLVFDNRDGKLIWRFAASWFCIWLFNIGLIALLARYTALNAYITGALALVPVTLISFVVQKFFVFGRNPQKKMPPAA